LNQKSNIPWHTEPLRKVAPPETRRLPAQLPNPCWLLNLDQIEKDTGYLGAQELVYPLEASASTHAFTKEHVLYSKLRPNLNKVVCPDQPGLCTTELIRLRPDPDKLSRKFLTYFLRSEHYMGFARTVVAGAKMPRMIMDRFWDFEIPLPPLAEQHRIVEILDQADTLRQQRRQADALSQRIIPALFHEMFGDPSNALQKWPSKGITEVCWPRQWPTISGKQLLSEGYPVFGANGLIGYYHSFNHEHPTIAITCRGATCGTINVTPPKCYITGNAMALDDLDDALVTQEFMIAFLNCRGLQDVITGAAQPQITRTNLEKVKIPIVPPEMLFNFSQASKSLNSIRSNVATSGVILETLFQNLLHRAFDGSLTAQWREAQAKELLQEMSHQAKAK
jgi:type I restriction enzyme S subunit